MCRSRAEQGGAASADSARSGVQKGGSGNTHKDGLSRPLRDIFFLLVETGKRKKRKLLLYLFQAVRTAFGTLLK